MQRSELIRKLRKGGWIVEPGNPHGKTYRPDNPKYRIPVPNGSKIKERTAKRILKDAGLQ